MMHLHGLGEKHSVGMAEPEGLLSTNWLRMGGSTYLCQPVNAPYTAEGTLL